MREAAAIMLAENIMSLNPKFQIEVRNVNGRIIWSNTATSCIRSS
jgi:hypothetical protein